MRWPVAISLCLAFLPGVCGCRSSGKNQLESELRAREEDVRYLKEELDRSEFANQALARELAAVRGLPGPLGVIEKPSEPYPVRSLRLGRGTAGRPAECGGDDALQVQVEPVDPEGQALKAPGTLFVEVLEISKEGLKRPLSSWVVPREELARRWQQGLFNTGYMLTFPWKVSPSEEKLRVQVRFQLVDGRLFEADKDITVRLLPEQHRKVRPAPSPGTPMLPGPTEVVPIPNHPASTPSLPSPPSEVKPPDPSPDTPAGPLLIGVRRMKWQPVQILRPVPLSPPPLP